MKNSTARSINFVVLTAVLFLSGCNSIGGSAEGSKESAQAFLSAELDKWIAGKPTTAKHFKVDLEIIKTGGKATPLSYKIDAVVPDDASMLNSNKSDDPAYRINTTLTFRSEAGNPTERSAAYNLTWNTKEKVWKIDSR